jgi:hypothetical protein
MMQRIARTLVPSLQHIGWVYFTNNFCIEDVGDVVVPNTPTPLDFVPMTPQNCERVQDFRSASLATQYAKKLRQDELGYFAMASGAAVGSIWATINRTEAPIVARHHMRLLPNEAVLHDGVTGERSRGMGVGTYMVASLSVALMTEHKVSRIVADINVRNRPSLRMMEKLGLEAKESTLSVCALGSLVWQMKMRPRV